MIEPGEHLLDGFDGRHIRQLRTADQDDLDTEFTRGGDLAVARRPTTILGDNNLDVMVLQKPSLVRLPERAALGQINRVRDGKRRLDRIDAADQVIVLRSCLEGQKLLPAKRQESFSRVRPQRVDRIATLSTSVHRSPGCGSQGERRRATIGTPEISAAWAALREIRAA